MRLNVEYVTVYTAYAVHPVSSMGLAAQDSTLYANRKSDTRARDEVHEGH